MARQKIFNSDEPGRRPVIDRLLHEIDLQPTTNQTFDLRHVPLIDIQIINLYIIILSQIKIFQQFLT